MEKMIVHPFFDILLRTKMTSVVVLKSKPVVGSSKNKMGCSVTSSIAILVLFLSSLDLGLIFWSLSRCRNSSTSLIRLLFSSLVIVIGRRRAAENSKLSLTLTVPNTTSFLRTNGISIRYTYHRDSNNCNLVHTNNTPSVMLYLK